MTEAQRSYYEACAAQARFARWLPRNQECDEMLAHMGMALDEIYRYLQSTTPMNREEYNAFAAAHIYGQDAGE